MKMLVNNCGEIETYNERVFNDIMIDKIMKQCNKSESEATEVLNKLYKDIDIFDEECTTAEQYQSIRHAIINRIEKCKFQ